jgi:putative protease
MKKAVKKKKAATRTAKKATKKTASKTASRKRAAAKPKKKTTAKSRTTAKRKMVSAKKSTAKKTTAKTAAKKTAAQKTGATPRRAPSAPKVEKPQAPVISMREAAPPTPSVTAPAPTAPPTPAEQPIGIVTHYYSHLSVAVVQLNEGTLRVGDTIHIKGHTTDLRQGVESMEIEHQSVPEASAGQIFGLKVRDHVREHDQIYKV